MKGMYNVVGLIDDNPNKKNYIISGKKILGNRYKILEVCKEHNVDTIFFSITNIDNKNKKRNIKYLPRDRCKNKNTTGNYRHHKK